MHFLDANKTAGEEARRQLHKNFASNIEQVMAATPNKASTIGPPASRQLEHTHSSYVRIRDVAPKTYQRRWMIGRSGERGSGISVLAARHDGDDGDKYLGMLETDTIKQEEMKEKIKKEYLWRTRKLLVTNYVT